MGSSSHPAGFILLKFFFSNDLSFPPVILEPFFGLSINHPEKEQQQNFLQPFSSICTRSAELLGAWDLVHLVNS